MSIKPTDTMKADQDRVRKLLTETVVMLCKSGLRYEDQLEIKGVIAITIDKKDVFIVHIDDKEMHGEIKSEIGHPSPCTTSDFDNQFCNGVPAKKMKVEDTSAYQDYKVPPTNFEQSLTHQMSLTSPHQRVSAPQFFTDDIDNQTPLQNMNSISQTNVVEPTKNVNQWALSIPNNPRHSTPVHGNNNNMVAIQQGQQRMAMMSHPRQIMHQNMNQTMRHSARMPMSQNRPMARMQSNPGHQRFQMQQQLALQQQSLPAQRMPLTMTRPPGGRGSGRGRGRASARAEAIDAMAGKLSVDSKNIDGFSYGKQTVTQYICNICGVVYKNHSSLLTHQVKTHGRQKKAGVGRRPKHSEDYDEGDASGMDGSFGGMDEDYDDEYLA